MSADSWRSSSSTSTSPTLPLYASGNAPNIGLSSLSPQQAQSSHLTQSNAQLSQQNVAAQNASTRVPAQSPHSATSEPAAEAQPWRFKGYPAFAEWVASSPDFFLLRRFNRLNAWVQLDWQDEIARLEMELEQLNEECRNRGYTLKARCNTTNPDRDPMPKRNQILKRLRKLLKDYNDFVLSHSQLRDRSTAEDFQVQNVRNWLKNNESAVVPEEQKWVDTGADVIPIIEKKKPWLRVGLERLGADRLTKIFPAKKRPGRVESSTTKYSSNKRMDATMTAILVVIGLAALLGPMWWLNAVQDDRKRLGVISGFVVLFTIILASATVQRPFEVLAGTAAYAAVLIVFLQQSSSSSGAG